MSNDIQKLKKTFLKIKIQKKNRFETSAKLCNEM